MVYVLVSDHNIQTGLPTNAKSPTRRLQEDQIQGGEGNNQSLSVKSETNQIVLEIVIYQDFLVVLAICCGEIESHLEELLENVKSLISCLLFFMYNNDIHISNIPFSQLVLTSEYLPHFGESFLFNLFSSSEQN